MLSDRHSSWSCFLGLLSISHLSSGLFPVGWCWRVVSKTREQSSSSLDSPRLKDYFTCPEGFSPVYTSSMLFAFFLMVFTVDWLSAYDPDLPLQNVYRDSGVIILDLGTDVFPIAYSAVPWNSICDHFFILPLVNEKELLLLNSDSWSIFIWGRLAWVMELWWARALGVRGRCYWRHWHVMADVTILSCENTS